MAIFNSYVCFPEGTPHTSIESHTHINRKSHITIFQTNKKHTAWRTENSYFDACCLTGNPHIPKIPLETPIKNMMFFPESVWAQGSSNSGGLYLIFSSSHLLIFTPSHLHTSSFSQLLIFTSSHLHIFSSSHLLIFTFSVSHLFIFTSSHLHIFTSSHLHIFSSSHLLIFTFSFSHLHICSSSHLLILPSCPLLLFYFSSEGGGNGSANETARNATLSHETRFDRQKLR